MLPCRMAPSRSWEAQKKHNVKIEEFVVCICIKHFVYFFVIVVINPEKKITYIPFLVAYLG